MTIYLDLIFLLNFFYDFLILLTVGIILKRKQKLYRYFLGALIGALSIFLLFIDISEIIIFFLKIIISILMIVITFKYITFRYSLNNFIYLYMVSIILAGFLYFLNITFSYEHIGFIFILKKISVNYLLLLIIAPIILLAYIKMNNYKKDINLYYRIEIFFGNEKIETYAFFDSGNNLIDPVTKKSIIIVHKKLLDKIYNIRSPMYVKYNTINSEGLMECFKPSYIVVNNHKIYNYLIGTTDYKFKDGVYVLLNNKLREDGYV